MIELKDLSDEYVQKIWGKFTITQKFKGTKIIVNKNGNGVTFLKNKLFPVTKIDLLMSDLYTKPIEILNTIHEYLPNNTKSFFIYNSEYKRLYLQGNSTEKDMSEIIILGPLFDGHLSATLQTAIEKKNEKKILRLLNVDKDATAIIFDNLNKDPKKRIRFKISINEQNEKHIPSEIYNLILIEVIRSVEIETLNKILITDTSSDQIYIDVIDKMFMIWVNKTKFKLSDIDLNYPDFMKVDVGGKVDMLNEPIRTAIITCPKLYDVYIMFLSTFLKETIKSNTYLTDSIKEKHSRIYNEIKKICTDKATSISIPSFYELIGQADI